MVENTQTVAETVVSKGLAARVFGVIFAPRATYQAVAARPRVLGVLLIVLVITVGTVLAFSSTEVGKQALLEQADQMAQRFGARMSDAQYAQVQARMTSSVTQYVGAVSQLIFIPLLAAIEAGLILAVFNAIMGGNATFKQVYAIVVHSLVLVALQQLFTFPLDYVKQSLSSPTSLTVFLPFLDETTFAARFLGVIDLFRLWWIVNLAIGIGVLYKKRTAPIATAMMVVYAVIALIVAGVGAALSGA